MKTILFYINNLFLGVFLLFIFHILDLDKINYQNEKFWIIAALVLIAPLFLFQNAVTNTKHKWVNILLYGNYLIIFYYKNFQIFDIFTLLNLSLIILLIKKSNENLYILLTGQQPDYKLYSAINIKKLKIIKGGIIGDSLLLPYEFLRKRKSQKRFLKHGLKQSLINGYGMTSDDSDHAIMTYQSLVNSTNKEDFQKSLSRKLKAWFFSFPIGMGYTTIKAIIKLLLCFSPQRSGIKSLGNGPLMRMSIISAYFSTDEEKRNEYLKASSEITHNHPETIKITQLLGNILAYVYNNDRKPNEEDLKNLLECNENNYPLTHKYVQFLLNNLNVDLESFLKVIESIKGVTGYIMTSSVFILYVTHNAKNYREAFEMIIRAGGDTDTIGAVVGSLFAILDNTMLEDKEMYKIILTSTDDILDYGYMKILIKNLVSIPIILAHGILRYL